MARSGEPEPSRPGASDALKSPEKQVEELHKLVADAQDKLDQVSRGLESLAKRLGEDGKAPRG